jgi:hypothetical protein
MKRGEMDSSLLGRWLMMLSNTLLAIFGWITIVLIVAGILVTALGGFKNKS